MSNKLSKAGYPLLSICKCLQMLKNVFYAELEAFGHFLHKGEKKVILTTQSLASIKKD